MASWEDFARNNIGQPIQQGVGNAAQLTDEQILALKQKALLGMAGSGAAAQVPAPPPPQAKSQMGVLPNDPSMTPQDQTSRMNAMIAAPLSGGTPLDFDTADKARAAQMELNQSAPASAPDDLSGYSAYPPAPPQPRQFPNIQKKMAPVPAKSDIRASTSPTQALTPEQEAKLFPKDDDDDNNKAGSAEGNY